MRPDGLFEEPLPKDPRVVGDDGRSSLRQSWPLLPCGAEFGARRSTGAGAFTPPDGLFEEPLPTGRCGAPEFGERLQSPLLPPVCPRWSGVDSPVPAPGLFGLCIGEPGRRHVWLEPCCDPLEGRPGAGFIPPGFWPLRSCANVRGLPCPAVEPWLPTMGLKRPSR